MIAIVAIALVLLAVRIAMPFAIQRYVNRVLDRSEAYNGSIGNVDVALWRGAYVIDDVKIEKRNGKVPVPFFSAPQVDLSVLWRQLFHGKFVGEVYFESPDLNVVAGRSSGAVRQTGADTDWRKTVEDLFPLRIDHVAVRDGHLHYRDLGSDPQVDVHLDQLMVDAYDLTNRPEKGQVARAYASAVPMGQGRLELQSSFDPFAKPPSFDLDMSVRGVRLVLLNDFFRAYGHFDVQKGSFSVYSELRARNGRFDGYVKPFFSEVEVLDYAEEHKAQSFFASVWEAIVGTGAQALKNHSDENQATRIPISGTVESPRIGFWSALGNALRNAYIQSLVPQLENSIPGPQ